MYWVKLTGADGKLRYVNLERFDEIIITKNETGDQITRILMNMTEDADETAFVDVTQEPESFLPLRKI